MCGSDPLGVESFVKDEVLWGDDDDKMDKKTKEIKKQVKEIKDAEDRAMEWDETLQGYIEGSFQRGEEAADLMPTSYDGQLYATRTGNEQAGLDLLLQEAQNAQGLGNSTIQLAENTLNGDYLSADSNPYLQSAMDAAIRPVTENLVEEALPQISSAAISQGAYGGARQDIEEQKALRTAERNALDITSQMADASYQRERQNQMMAPQMLSQGAQLNQVAPRTMMEVGQADRAENQLGLKENLDKFNLDKSLLWEGPERYAGIINGTAGLGYSPMIPQMPQQQQSDPNSGLKGAIGGGLTGYQAAGPWGATAGAIAGGLLG